MNDQQKPSAEETQHQVLSSQFQRCHQQLMWVCCLDPEVVRCDHKKVLLQVPLTMNY